MKRRIAVVGDTLTNGGNVLSYEQKPNLTFHGHQLALIGGKAFCDACGSIGSIAKAGGPRRISYLGMRDSALDGDIVLCDCAVPPQIVARRGGDSVVDDEAERRAPASIARSSSDDTVSGTCSQPLETYDEQVTPFASGTQLEGYPYAVELSDGRTICGRIDRSGYLPRIHTDSVETYSIHWGERAMNHGEWMWD